MNRSDTELLLGAAIALVAGLAVFMTVGVPGLLYLLGLALIGFVALALWHSKAHGAKVLAAILVPMLAVAHWMSKPARSGGAQKFSDDDPP
jgi:uncharacterized membrane-anchored protein